MSVSRNKGLFLVIALVILAAYNVAAFAIPFGRGGGFWVSYGFSTLSVLLAAGVTLYALSRGGLHSKFYGLSLVSVALSYFIAQMALGFIFMATAAPLWVNAAASSLVLAFCLAGLIASDIGISEVERIDAGVSQKTFFVRSSRELIEGLAAGASDENLKKSLKTLSDAIRYSDPVSIPQLDAIEREIESKTAALSEYMRSGNGGAAEACGELEHLWAERNRQCKILK
jgi:hypothetical protein